MMNITETIKKRRSCRSFSQQKISPVTMKFLEDFIFENRKLIGGEIINLRIIQKTDEDKKLKLDYGVIKGNDTYLLGTSITTKYSRINYGYLMEKVVLKATELGLSTCWIGYFDKTYFKDTIIENGREIPCVAVLGYSENKPTYLEKLIRFSVKASKRHSWEKLFFNYSLRTSLNPTQINNYQESLEMVRLAPSSGNTQPWRVFFDEKTNEFHFFKKTINKKYEEIGMHNIDMGIALSHFELTSLQNNLSGSWIVYPKDIIHSIDELEYCITWKCEY